MSETESLGFREARRRFIYRKESHKQSSEGHLKGCSVSHANHLMCAGVCFHFLWVSSLCAFSATRVFCLHVWGVPSEQKKLQGNAGSMRGLTTPSNLQRRGCRGWDVGFTVKVVTPGSRFSLRSRGPARALGTALPPAWAYILRY